MNTPKFHLRLYYLMLGFFLLTYCVWEAPRARAAEPVDLVIVLALDVSASVDDREYDLMRAGLAGALTSPNVLEAVLSGEFHAIGVSVVQWSGFQEQVVKIDWRRITNREQLLILAEDIKLMDRRYDGGATDIGGALDFCRELISKAPFQGLRSVIDIAGDGSNNVNASPAEARDETNDAGITINALVVTGDAGALAEYYARFVIGGNGAFVEKTHDYDGFERAMQRKLIQEMDAKFLY